MISSFASETDAIVAQHEQQTARLTKQIEQLAQQLSASEGKLEVLQRTAVHVQDDKQVRRMSLARCDASDAIQRLVMRSDDRAHVGDAVREAADRD